MQERPDNRLEAFLRLFQKHGLDELIVEEGDFKVHLRSGRAETRALPARPAQARREARRAPPVRERRRRTVAVRSPLIGVFYRSPGPDAAPFVELGEVVEEGQTVCIVEAMKVFNEIKAEWRGQVVAVPVENGQLVQAGEPLVVLAFTED